jgi:hypothetical protein
MRLFWAGIVHFDLHTKNFLLYVDQNGILQGKIIDLGNSIIFTNEPNKFIPDPADIATLIGELGTYKDAIIANIGNDTFIHKKDFVVGLLDMIKAFDTKGNHQVFPHDPRYSNPDDHINCQMSWWPSIKDKEAADIAGTDESFSKIIDDAYNLARGGFMVDIDARHPGVSSTTIQRYIGQGRLPSFNDINPIMVHWPWAAPGAAGNPQGMAVGPGGGARKQSRRKHKFRKNKTKRLALRKTKNKKRRRTSKK